MFVVEIDASPLLLLDKKILIKLSTSDNISQALFILSAIINDSAIDQ